MIKIIFHVLIVLRNKDGELEIGIREKMKREIGRYTKFRTSILEKETEKAPEVQELDIRNYAKYLLREGSIIEKRELLINLKSKLILQDKSLYLK